MSYNALIRPLKNGNEFNSLFPTPKEKKVRLGKGDTHTSIELIIKWALENNNEVKLVAPKLQKSSLSETCFAIHDFLFNHFQYEADGEAQLLRSPAYAWKHRYKGIDCKSYSIVASCILLQLGIKHYIRKIKQPAFNPENFTHVYVIVPVNQDSGNLKQGYYTIDGTLKTTKEPIYIDKKDFFMDKLEHYGLKGIDTVSLSQLDFSSLSSLFNGLDCIGGSAYDQKYLKNNITLINKIFTQYVADINNSVVNDIESLGTHVASFKGFAKLLDAAFRKSKSEGWNSCSTANFNATLKVTEYFLTTGINSLEAWLQKYFSKSNQVSTLVFKNYKSLTTGFEDGTGFWGTSAGGAETVVINEPVYNYTISSNEDIKQFALTSYTLESHKSNTFSAETFLQGLSNVLVSVSGTTGTSGNGTSVDENGQVIYDEQNPKTTSAGGYLLGALAFLGLVTWGFSKMKDKK